MNRVTDTSWIRRGAWGAVAFFWGLLLNTYGPAGLGADEPARLGEESQSASELCTTPIRNADELKAIAENPSGSYCLQKI